MTSSTGPLPDAAPRTRAPGTDAHHHAQHLLAFVEQVAAQTVGTVIGAGVLYVLASWLGMVHPPSPQAVAVVVFAAAGPLLVAVLPLRRRR